MVSHEDGKPRYDDLYRLAKNQHDDYLRDDQCDDYRRDDDHRNDYCQDNRSKYVLGS